MVNDATGTITKSYDWDVYNRMVKSTVESSDSSIVVSTYLYDHTGRRIMKETMSNTASGSTTSTSIYPFSDYEVTDSGSTKVSVSANNLHVATINSQPSTINQQPSTNIFFSHTDHLGGGNVMTDEQGNFAQALDYFPFGSVRIDEQYADLDERKKFTGHELDDETNLYYAQARYYDSEIGRFISQDPLQWRPVELMKRFSEQPQALNFFSYTINNPIVKVDPQGEFIFDIVPKAKAPASEEEARQMPSYGPSIFDAAKTDASNYLEHQGYQNVAAVLLFIGGTIETVNDYKSIPKISNEVVKDIKKVINSLEKGKIKNVIPDLGKTRIVAPTDKKALTEADRLSGQYGGSPKDYSKHSTYPPSRAPTGEKYEIHFYQNNKTGEKFEEKSKLIERKKK